MYKGFHVLKCKIPLAFFVFLFFFFKLLILGVGSFGNFFLEGDGGINPA